jgi:hypothetical protein
VIEQKYRARQCFLELENLRLARYFQNGFPTQAQIARTTPVIA